MQIFFRACSVNTKRSSQRVGVSAELLNCSWKNNIITLTVFSSTPVGGNVTSGVCCQVTQPVFSCIIVHQNCCGCTSQCFNKAGRLWNSKIYNKRHLQTLLFHFFDFEPWSCSFLRLADYYCNGSHVKSRDYFSCYPLIWLIRALLSISITWLSVISMYPCATAAPT